MVVGTSSVSWRQWKINKKVREILGVVERERGKDFGSKKYERVQSLERERWQFGLGDQWVKSLCERTENVETTWMDRYQNME